MMKKKLSFRVVQATFLTIFSYSDNSASAFDEVGDVAWHF